MFNMDAENKFDMSYLNGPYPYGVRNCHLRCFHFNSYYKKVIQNLVFLDNLPFWKKNHYVTANMVDMVNDHQTVEGEDFYWMDITNGEIIFMKDFYY